MTSTTPHATATTSTAVGEPPARFPDLVAAEWIKVRSLRSTPWVIVLVTLVVTGVAAARALADYNNFPSYDALTRRDHPFSLGDAFPAEAYLTLMLAAVAVGAIATVSEYGSGLIRTTTVAVPARGAVVLAKAVVQAVLWAVVGALVALCSFLVSQAILEGRDAAIPISDPDALRAFAASALLGPVCALVGLGLGVLIRHSATTVVAGSFVLLLLPVFFSSRKPLSAAFANAMVRNAWQRLAQIYGTPAEAYNGATVAGSWTVYVLWPLVALALALVVVRRRDV
ncbi:MULTISPECIES: ABC transporter permease [unclassified Streptomyces]|uniref:ABC transporter permease n=1 Tax=unclassified Streptomyces TaxID=2593676 RepID=UPI00224E3592|nr:MULTISPECIES: ABC transporter permease [unclassified Streptomyces]MCX5436309.1 ABC transporter permease [Streptomyces sp. NBC_00063]WSE14089.1 ABC transporter permease [Streptomyces sp. NBC_01397]WUB96992.1 ABC transporter permease [Streptomyces sp. NBC_00569]